MQHWYLNYKIFLDKNKNAFESDKAGPAKRSLQVLSVKNTQAGDFKDHIMTANKFETIDLFPCKLRFKLTRHLPVQS